MKEWAEWSRGIGARSWLAVWALLLVLQFFAGQWVGRNPGLRNFERPTVPNVAPLEPMAAVESTMLAWFPKVEADTKVLEKTLALQGVLGVVSARKAVIAVLSPEGVFESRRIVSAGEEVEGWKVVKIERSSAQLQRAADSKVLRMFPARPGAAP